MYEDFTIELARIERAAYARLRERDKQLQLGEAWSDDDASTQHVAFESRHAASLEVRAL
jgi:hypothetical protein